MNLVKGAVITFSGDGGVLTLTHRAIIGDTSLKGDVTTATISRSETSTSIVMNTVMELFSSGVSTGKVGNPNAGVAALYLYGY